MAKEMANTSNKTEDWAKRHETKQHNTAKCTPFTWFLVLTKASFTCIIYNIDSNLNLSNIGLGGETTQAFGGKTT